MPKVLLYLITLSKSFFTAQTDVNMDHLPRVRNPYTPIHVPYLGGGEYDGQVFAEYPVRQGWNIDYLQQGDFQGRTANTAAQFLQTWLYFGMMHELFVLEDGDRVTVRDFVRSDSTGRQLINNSLSS